MYRSLCDRGSLTDYVSLDVVQFNAGPPNPIAPCKKANMHGPTRFASVLQSEGTRTTYPAPVFLPADQIQVTFVPGGSISDLVRENSTDSAEYETV